MFSIRNKRLGIRIFTFVSIFLLTFSLIIPAMILHATSFDQNKSQQQELNPSVEPSEKMDDHLLEAFKESDQVTYLIKFRGKANVKQVAEKVRNEAKANHLSSSEQVFLQRSAVVSELKTTALHSQENVKNYLEEEVAKGKAENLHSYYIVNGIAVTSSIEVAKQIARFPEVEKLLPDEQRQLFTTATSNSNTSKPISLQSENGLADDIEWNVDRVNAQEAWDMGITGAGTVVASIDSGVEWNHPALKEKYRGYDSVTGEVNHDYNWFDATVGQEEPYDDIDHGTHVTGTMVGSEPDDSNVIGVAPGAKWIAVKAFTSTGGRDTDLLEAAEWILAPTDAEGNERVDMAPDVVNNSWGGGRGLDEWYRDVVIAWRAANIFPEFSAGNTNLSNPGGPYSIASPANYPESFATGATDIDDNLASFSLRGPSPYEEIKPDISAPGVHIRSSIPGGGYDTMNGTSMAGPAVSAVAAMLRQVDSTISVDDMEEILLESATPLIDEEYPESPNNGYGYGLVDAFEAVTFITDGVGSIEGTVTTDGEDNEEPTYNHVAPLEVYEGMDTNFAIDVQDNISIISVEFTYQINDGEQQTIDATQVSGDHKDGSYEVLLSGDVLAEGELTYQWIINDYGENTVTSESYEVPVTTGITVGYFEDFEEQPAGWTTFGMEDVWEWGIPTSGPEEAASGDHVYATKLDGLYPNNADATLVMPAVNLPEGENYLQFDIWYDLVEVHDVGYVYVSTDQKEWNMEKIFFYDSDGWETVEIDLTDYSGERIYIGFNILSNTLNDVDKPGMYLDNVALSSTSMDSNHLIRNDNQRYLMEENAILTTEKTEMTQEFAEDPIVKRAAFPLSAELSVLGTSRSTKTNPADGTYTLSSLASGTYTVEANAYGYFPEQQSVTVEGETATQLDFILEEIPQHSVHGVVTDEATGEPIEGANVLLVEDANVTPVTTDEQGHFELTVYEGTYTLKVISQGYHYGEQEIIVEEGMSETNVVLPPFYSFEEEEIGYDDGTGEFARTFYGPGNRAAVKITIPEEKGPALITDGVFQFQHSHQPYPGGTNFAVEVWDATGRDGLPGNKLAGPIQAEAIRDVNILTVVDLRNEHLIVDGDFYMVYVQTNTDNYSPGLGSDANGPYAGRSYEFIHGYWDQSHEIEGNYMIRARVSYDVSEPVITSPIDDKITDEAELTIEGTATPQSTVQILNNEEAIGVVEVDEHGNFSVAAELTEGENELFAITLIDGQETKISDPVTVILDTVAPSLEINSPVDGELTNQETITVKGIVLESNLDVVTINGEPVEINMNGDTGVFSQRILLDEGENHINVTAEDAVGHVVTETFVVDADFSTPVLENVQPNENQVVESGDTLMISFDSEPGLEATYSIQLPLMMMGTEISSITELEMNETETGHYIGYWTIPNHIQAHGAVIQITAQDAHGNETKQFANGRLIIN